MPHKIILYFFFLLITVNGFAQTDKADELYRNAMQLKTEGNCNDAVEFFKKSILLKPDFTAALYELGWCYNELHLYNEALFVLQKALLSEPTSHKIIYEMGFAKYKLGQINAALEDYNKAILLNPSFAKAYAARADLYKDAQKNTAAALADYLKAIEFDTTTVTTYYWAGWCCNDLNQFEKAIPYLQKAIGFEKQNYLSFAEIGFSYFSLNRYDEALLHLVKADALKPHFETILYYIGMCYVRQNKKPDAIKKYNELVSQNSGYAGTLLNEIKNMK